MTCNFCGREELDARDERNWPHMLRLWRIADGRWMCIACEWQVFAWSDGRHATLIDALEDNTACQSQSKASWTSGSPVRSIADRNMAPS
jgi:hypothetical protein